VTVERWITFVTAVLVLMSTPGPSQLLMLSNSLGNGFRRSLATASGDLTANALQMTVASFGLAALVHASPEFFVTVKWVGVGFLIYLGVSQILRGGSPAGRGGSGPRSISSLYWQGFVTSAANPRAVVFFAALFPQFLDPSRPTMPQLLALGATYVAIDGLFLSGYGLFAGWIASRLGGTTARHANRLSGALLIGAALLLGLKSVVTGQ
jgi:threonine/homoserine/homoserine lactone efflux protein